MEPFRSETRIDGETRALSLLPRFNLAIQSIEMSVQRPDGGTEILFFANDIPLEWPTPYIFGEPVLLPRGSLLRATAYFENTSDTPLLAREVGLGILEPLCASSADRLPYVPKASAAVLRREARLSSNF